ncbi:MAG: transketolase [bacterium]|nr:transketolase [bacterium]
MPKLGKEKITYFENLARLIRYYCLLETTKAGSGHLTSSLSAADLTTVLFFDKFCFDFKHPKNPQNDRLVFSKGHASPLLYSLYRAAGLISERELLTYRQLGSRLEGHPVPNFPYVDAATGSLGQGLSVGMGMALAAKYLDKTDNKIYVLLGDGETAEGSVWEAIELAAHYKLGNLVGIIDVNRLGQSQETLLGHRVEVYRDRIAAFDWQTIVIDGHDFNQIEQAFSEAVKDGEKPTMIIAKTIKGKGLALAEDNNGWHAKTLSEAEFQQATKELGEIDLNLVGSVKKPQSQMEVKRSANPVKLKSVPYQKGEKLTNRKAFGQSLVQLVSQNPDFIVLDGDVKNSTFTELVEKDGKNNFFEMFIAEQNMVGVAGGLAARGRIPVVATFACFFTRAFDQIRMNAISGLNIKYVGTHAGVSIGYDGPSQMGLEDLAMFRAVQGCVVLYPADGVAAAKLTEEMLNHQGATYLRLARPDVSVIYEAKENFPIGGSKILVSSKKDQATIVAAGITVFEALTAQKELEEKGINVRVIDCYSVKPIDEKTLGKVASETGGKIITVEDHWFEGGLGDAVLNIFAGSGGVKVYKMAVCQMPHSGSTVDNLHAAGIDAKSIVQKVKQILKER